MLLERALDEAMLRLHPEERELQHLADLDARYARLDESTYNHSGIAEFIIRGDWSDLKAFDDTITTLAAALAQTGCEETGSEESLDVRRSIAVGILADPEAALALLHRPPAPQTPAKAKAKAKRGSSSTSTCTPTTSPASTPSSSTRPAAPPSNRSSGPGAPDPT